MKNILNVVITGGPCGGKTTALNEITNELRSYGYTVYIVNETATEFINDGIKPFGDNKLSVFDFQSLLFDAQIAKENIRREAANICSNDKVAIIYDRGILDNRAYLSNQEFEDIINKRTISEAEIISRYDLVLHMTTAAIGKEEFYTLENNSARTETKEEARLLDKKTMETWKNHPNLKIVSNDCLFDQKINKVKNIIRAYLGEDEVINKERYIVSDIDLDKFNYNVVKEDIEEFVDKYDDELDIIYTKSTINGSSYYTASKNKYYKDGNKVTTCKTISEEEYLSNLERIHGNIINKTRYNFIVNNERYRLDIYNDSNITILDRFVTDKSNNKLPEFIINAKNISNNRDYDDDSIYVDYNIGKVYKKK